MEVIGEFYTYTAARISEESEKIEGVFTFPCSTLQMVSDYLMGGENVDEIYEIKDGTVFIAKGKIVIVHRGEKIEKIDWRALRRVALESW